MYIYTNQNTVTMSIIKDSKGNTTEAFDLIMRKEFAWDILEGRKKAEFRNLSAFYIKRFFVPKKTLQETLDAFELKDACYVHFHDYGNTWYLDVRLNDFLLLSVHPDCLDLLHQLDCYEFDEMAKENAGKSAADVLQFFALKIYSILGTNLASLSDIEKTGKVKVDPIIREEFIPSELK